VALRAAVRAAAEIKKIFMALQWKAAVEAKVEVEATV
jgi:hypothetical protein